jgi:hypothetical protein
MARLMEDCGAGYGTEKKSEDHPHEGVLSVVILRHMFMGPFGWNYKPAEKHCWLIFCERKILFRLKKTRRIRWIISQMNKAYMQACNV